MAAPVQAVPERRCSLEEILPPSSTPIQHGRTHSLSSSYASSYDEEGEYGSARYSFSSQVSIPSTPQSFSNHNSSCSRRLSGPHQLLTRQVVEQLSKESPMMAVPSVEDGEDGWLSRTVHSAPVRTARYLLRKYSRRETALCCIEKQHPLRHRLRRLVKSKWFNAGVGLIVLLHLVVLAVVYKPYNNEDFNRDWNLPVVYATVPFVFIYMVEAVIRVIANGLILHSKAYLRRPYHLLDVLVILVGLYYIIQREGVAPEALATLMSLRLLVVLTIFESVNFIVRVLYQSMLPLFYLGRLFLCVIVFFALIGMELFSEGLLNGCFVNYTTAADELKCQRVSEYPCNRMADPPGAHKCDQYDRSYCTNWPQGPNAGLTGFDNILTSLLTVFQCMTLEGWTSVLYLYESAYGYSYVWIYFILLVFIGSVFLLNMLLGVMTSVFVGVSERQLAQGSSRRLKERQRIEDDLKGYHNWIRRALDDDQFSSDAVTSRIGNDVEEEEEEEEKEAEGWDIDIDSYPKLRSLLLCVRGSRRVVKFIVKSDVFFWFMIGVITINLIVLATTNNHASCEHLLAIKIINYMFTVLYILECAFKLYGLGPQLYFRSFFNIFELICTLINLVDVLVLVHITAIQEPVSAIVNTCRGFRLILTFKYTRYWQGMKEMMGTLKDSISSILSLLSLMFALLMFFSLFGMRVFGRRLTAHNEYHPNFNDIFSSILLVFQLFTTEDWHTLMYRTANSYSTEVCSIDASDTMNPIENKNDVNFLYYLPSPVVLYYLTVVIFVGFIFVNVFLAIAVDNLSEVNAVKEDQTMRSELQEEMRKERREKLNALKNPSRPQMLRRTLQRVLLFSSGVSDSSSPQRKRRPPLPRRVQSLITVPPRPEREYVRKSGSVATPPTYPLLDTIRTLRNERIGERRDSEKHVDLANPLTKVDDEGGDQAETKESRMRRLSSVNSAQSVGRRHHSLDGIRTYRPSIQSTVSQPVSEPTGRAEQYDISVDTTAQHDHEQVNANDVVPGSVSRESLESYRQSSVQSAPEHTPRKRPHHHSFERTQSLPHDVGVPHIRPPLTRQSSLEVSPNMKTHQPHTDSQYRNNAAPLALFPDGWKPAEVEEEVAIDRLVRQSSLEVISPVDISHTHQPTQHKEKSKTWTKLQTKARALWAWLKNYLGTIQFNPQEELLKIPEHSAFFILSPDNRLRVLCYKLVTTTVFQILSYGMIILGSGLLACEIALPDPNPSALICLVQRLIIILDSILVAWFLLEMCMKMVALGVIFHQGSYFRGLFNTLDFIVAVTSAIPLLYYFTNSEAMGLSESTCLSYSYLIPSQVGVLRPLRVFRIFRFFRIKGLYLLIQGLLATLKTMGYVVSILGITIAIFAIIGVLLFNGRYQYCSDLITTNREDCHGRYFQYPSGDLNCPIVKERMWLLRELRFDNILLAILTLCTMLTKEGWQDVMYNAIDSTGVNMGTVRDNYPQAALYFLVYMVVITFCLLNLFVAFVIVTFQQVGVKSYKEADLDRNQRNCVYYALTARLKKVYQPHFNFHVKLYRLVTSSAANVIILIALGLNTALLALQAYAIPWIPEQWNTAIYWANVGFTVFFVLETVVKIVIITPPNYFRCAWNVFAFLISLGAILEFVLQQTVPDFAKSDMNMTHIASSFRVLRLLEPTKEIRLILWTVVQSLEIFPWVGVLLVTLIYIFAALGVHLFGAIRIGSIDNVTATTAITMYNNFGNFPQAVLVMIRSLTGENWEQIMLSCDNRAPCDPSILNITTNTTNRVCGNDMTYVFFPLFFGFGVILILNLFVAIILDNFDYYVRDKSILGSHHLADFPKLWAKFDPTASGKIGQCELMKLMSSLNPPLGWGKLCHQTLVYRKMMQLNVPLNNDDTVSFNSTLLAIVCLALGIESHGDNAALKQRLAVLFPDRGLDTILPTGADTTRRHYAALLIQYHWRRWKVSNEGNMLSKSQKWRRRLSYMALLNTQDTGPQLLQRELTSTNLAATLQTVEDKESVVELNKRPSSLSLSHRPVSAALGKLGTIVETEDMLNDMVEEKHSLANDREKGKEGEGEGEGDTGDGGGGGDDDLATRRHLLLKFQRASILSEADLFLSAPSTPQGSPRRSPSWLPHNSAEPNTLENMSDSSAEDMDNEVWETTV